MITKYKLTSKNFFNLSDLSNNYTVWKLATKFPVAILWIYLLHHTSLQSPSPFPLSSFLLRVSFITDRIELFSHQQDFRRVRGSRLHSVHVWSHVLSPHKYSATAGLLPATVDQLFTMISWLIVKPAATCHQPYRWCARRTYVAGIKVELVWLFYFPSALSHRIYVVVTLASLQMVVK